MSIELFSDTVDLSSIYVKEALEDGSFSYTDGNSPSARLKLVVRGALEAYPAYMAVVNYLQRTYGDENGYISMCNIPLSTINLSKMACDFAYSVECTFQFEEDSGGNNEDGSSNSRNSNNRGTSPNNPIINNDGFQMPEIQASDFQYANTGGSKHLSHAYSQSYYILTPETTTFVDHHNGIKVSEGGECEGVDLVYPAEVFSVTISAPNYWLTTYYRSLITECTGCTNSEPFWGYAPECVLFKGITASPVALNYTDMNGDAVKSWYWRIKYEFEARRGIIIPPPKGTYRWRDSASQVANQQAEAERAKLKSKRDELAAKIYTNVEVTTVILENIVEWINLNNNLPYSRFIRLLGYGDNPPLNMENVYATYVSDFLEIAAVTKKLDSLDKSDEDGSVEVPGYRYIWYSNPKKVTDSKGNLISNYLQINVAQVYPTYDFNKLNLPQISDAD